MRVTLYRIYPVEGDSHWFFVPGASRRKGAEWKGGGVEYEGPCWRCRISVWMYGGTDVCG